MAFTRTTADLRTPLKQMTLRLWVISVCTHFSAVYRQLLDPIFIIFRNISVEFFNENKGMCEISTTVHPPSIFHCFPKCVFCHKRSLTTAIIFQPSILKWDLMEGTDAKMKQWWNHNEMLTDILFLLMLPEILICINSSRVASRKLHSFI